MRDSMNIFGVILLLAAAFFFGLYCHSVIDRVEKDRIAEEETRKIRQESAILHKANDELSRILILKQDTIIRKLTDSIEKYEAAKESRQP